MTLKFDGWPWKIIGHLFYATSSFVHHFVAIGVFKLLLQSGNAQSESNSTFLEPCGLEIWRMTFKNDRAPLLCYFNLCASFRSHWWIQTGVRVRKRPIWVKFDALEPCDLEIWRMTLKNNRAPLLSIIKLYASFRRHMWIQTGVTVQKRLNWVLTSVPLTFDLWPRPFAWTSLLSLVITSENFMMIRWWEHSLKAVKQVWQTDRRPEKTIHRAAWSQLTISIEGSLPLLVMGKYNESFLQVCFCT